MHVSRPVRVLAPIAVAAFVLFGYGLADAPKAGAQAAGTDQPVPADDPGHISTYTDSELVASLRSAGLLEDWIRISGISPEGALVTVHGRQYEERRHQLLADIELLGERRRQLSDYADHAVSLSATVDNLEELTRILRRDVAVTGRRAAVSITPAEAEAAHRMLNSIVGTRRWMGVSIDPFVLVEHQIAQVRDQLSSELAGLSVVSTQKSQDSSLTRLTGLHKDLVHLVGLIDTGRRRLMVAEIELTAHRAALLVAIDDLHDARLLSPTSVGGLPVVTLDAYVQAAAAVDPTCPVDWNLLAGIGRVESRHGTTDDAVVQPSGQVSISILGPLLDGGATEREAVAAEQAATAAAAAALLAEEAAAKEPSAPVFDGSLWGDDTLTRVEEQAASAAVEHAPVGRAAPPVIIEEVPAPRYDPLLWGDELPFDEADLPELELEHQLIDEGEAEFRGNGFAVIEDSDEGRLDGNDQWDRAVGPMQFIPETWSYWETDGNRDGIIDPQNMYDAAATAARFLCHLSRTRGESPYAFVLGYNSSQVYVRNVMAVSDAFGASTLLSPQS